jgi:hypothetical protein
MMMKDAHQIWIITMTMEVDEEEEEEVGAVIDNDSHEVKCVFHISIRVLELKKEQRN